MLLLMKLYLFGFIDYYMLDEEFGNFINFISDINLLLINLNYLLVCRLYLFVWRFLDIVIKFFIVYSFSDFEYE